MRLLQAMAGGRYGGAEAFFERLAIAFEKTELTQELLIRRNSERVLRFRAAAVRLTELSFGGRLDWTTGRGFRRAIADFRPDVVLTWMSRASRFCPRATPEAPFVHVGRLGGYYDLKYYSRCDHLIGNTLDIQRYLVEAGWPEKRAHCLPNFVEARRSPPIPRETFKTPSDAPLLLGLGRLHGNKAFDVLIEALASTPEAYLWLAGEGPLRKRLEALAERWGVADRVRFLGWRDDTPALFAAADLFVCPSRVEPLGNVVIEAWAHGAPAVAAESAGPKCLIEHEVNGLLVPIDDPKALAEAVQRVIDDPALAGRLRAEGQKTFEASYTEEAVVPRYLAFFREVTR